MTFPLYNEVGVAAGRGWMQVFRYWLAQTSSTNKNRGECPRVVVLCTKHWGSRKGDLAYQADLQGPKGVHPEEVRGLP